MSNVQIASRRKSLRTLEREYPEATFIDVTSKSTEPWIRFSPFYPIGPIPIPFSPGHYSQTVEGLWQGLKVFESHDVDPTKFEISSMKGLKRTVRKYGKVMGHRRGVHGESLLTYVDARKQLYLPAYRYVLDTFLGSELEDLRTLLRKGSVVLLDYETNTNVEDTSKPLSHASLIARHISE